MKIGFRDGAWAECINHGCRCVAYCATHRLPEALYVISICRHGILQAEGLKQLSPGQAGLAGAALGIGTPHPIFFSA
jgi:hypothetical protein